MKKAFGCFDENEMFWILKRVLDVQAEVKETADIPGSAEYLAFLESIREKLANEIRAVAFRQAMDCELLRAVRKVCETDGKG
jgi:hypothetical protein